MESLHSQRASFSDTFLPTRLFIFPTAPLTGTQASDICFYEEDIPIHHHNLQASTPVLDIVNGSIDKVCNIQHLYAVQVIMSVILTCAYLSQLEFSCLILLV